MTKENLKKMSNTNIQKENTQTVVSEEDTTIVSEVEDTKIDVAEVADTKTDVADVPEEKDTKIDVDEVEDTKIDVAEVEDTKIVINNNVDTSENVNNEKKNLNKISRTIMLKLINTDQLFYDNITENIIGLINKTLINNKILYLTLDNHENAMKAYNLLRSKAYNNFYIKFSYYKLFFTINGLLDTSDYSETKKDLIEYISTDSNIKVLYCKFYCKNKSYLGCGDLTVDTIEGMNKLLSKINGFKEFKFKSFSGVFYKFNKKQEEF